MNGNRSRVMIVIVVVFVVVLSFFAGRYSMGKAPVTTTTTSGTVNSGTTGSNDRAGVPPDSLHH